MRAAIALVACCWVASPVAARSQSRAIAYAPAQVWSTAVRFLAIDAHAKITDRDPDAGYLVFELPDAGKQWRGTLEIVALTVDGNPGVRFVIDVADRPLWMEAALLKRLEQKLRNELGPPAAPRPKPAPKPAEDKPTNKPDDKPESKQPPIARDP